MVSVSLALLLLAARPEAPPGEVVLPLDAYNTLVDAAARHNRPMPAPPEDASVRQARYRVSVQGAQARVVMTAVVDVLGPGRFTQTLLGSDSALLSLAVDAKPEGALVLDEHYAVELAPGSHTVELEVAVPVDREGPSELQLAVPAAVTARLEMALPGVGWNVQVGGVDNPQLGRSGGNTLLTAALPVTRDLKLSWVRQGADEGDEEPVPANTGSSTPGRARAQVLHHVAVEEAVVRGSVRVTLSIQKGTRTQASVLLPANVEVLDVQATDLREWTAAKDGDVRRVLVAFKYGRTGEVPLTIRYERMLKDGAGRSSLELPEPVVEDVESDRGFVGVEAAPGVEVSLAGSEGAEALDGRDLPAELWSMGTTPLVLGLKYLEHPVKVTLGLSQRAKVAVADTTLDRVDFETVVNPEGRAVSAINWYVRNHQRQFLEVTLPAEAQVLSCFVNGKPVRPARGGKDTLFIPLDRSTAAEGHGAAFPVELVIAQAAGKLGPVKSLDLQMPATGVQAMELSWRVYVPGTHLALGFGGNFSAVTSPRSTRRWFASLLSSTPLALAGGGEWSRSKSEALEGYDMTQGVKARWAQRRPQTQTTAAVRVSRPLVGRLYEFRANLMRAEAPQVRLTLVKRGGMRGLGLAALGLMVLATLLLAEDRRRHWGALMPQGVDGAALPAVPLSVRAHLGIMGVALVLAAWVGLYLNDVLPNTLLAALLAPGWWVVSHLRASVRAGARWWGWPVWAAALGLWGMAALSGLSGSFLGTVMLLAVAFGLALLARRALWRVSANASAPSGSPVAAASSVSAPPIAKDNQGGGQ